MWHPCQEIFLIMNLHKVPIHGEYRDSGNIEDMLLNWPYIVVLPMLVFLQLYGIRYNFRYIAAIKGPHNDVQGRINGVTVQKEKIFNLIVPDNKLPKF